MGDSSIHGTFYGTVYNNCEGTINERPEKEIKKQKISHDKAKDTGDINFSEKWVEFLADAENNGNFHEYSPEKNGVTRLGAKLSPHPKADKEAYRHLKKQLKPCEASGIWANTKEYISDIIAANDIDEFKRNVEAKLPISGKESTCQYINNVCRIMGKVYTKRPTISRSETVYNTNLIFPCLEAMLEPINDTSALTLLPVKTSWKL
ncbi:unnamed protein product [Mucor hiemalis]